MSSAILEAASGLPPSPPIDCTNCQPGCDFCYHDTVDEIKASSKQSSHLQSAGHYGSYGQTAYGSYGDAAAYARQPYDKTMSAFYSMSDPSQRPFVPLSHNRSFGMSRYGVGYYPSVPAVAVPAHEQPQQQHAPAEPAAPESREEPEKPQGGVCEKLDYDMDVMAGFLTRCVLGLFALARAQTMSEIDIVRSLKRTRIPSDAAFRKWVYGVLTATRLPRPSIMYAVHYMALRLRGLGDVPKTGENAMYQYLTVSLLLGSKFNDDNTFINKSWATVTGLEVTTINSLEKEWLTAFGYNLYYSHDDVCGLGAWYDFYSDSVGAPGRKGIAAKSSQSLAPINTALWFPFHSESTGLPSPPTSACSETSSRRASPDAAGWTTASLAAGSQIWSTSACNSSIPSPASSSYAGPTTPGAGASPQSNAHMWTPPESYHNPYSQPRTSFDACASRFNLPAQTGPCGPSAFASGQYAAGPFGLYPGPVMIAPGHW